MHHVKPSSKGDPLCPLGFHPQVRWPTRCKRCFRDYKEHGNRKEDPLRRDDLTVSTPSLSSLSSLSRSRDDSRFDNSILGTRNWTSSSNLSTLGVSDKKFQEEPKDNKSSWTSTPNLAEASSNDAVTTTVSITLPRRRRPSAEPSEPEEPRKSQYVRRKTDSSILPSRRTSSPHRLEPKVRIEEIKSNTEVDFTFHVKPSNKKPAGKPPPSGSGRTRLSVEDKNRDGSSSPSKSTSSSDDESISGRTDTTSTTLVNMRENELLEEIESLKKELDLLKGRCEKAEREKSDLMFRRLASIDSTSSSKSENLKLQQKVNELKGVIEDLRDDKKSLNYKVRELESELDGIKAVGAQKELEILKVKMDKAEQLVEQVMEENQDMRREIRDMEEEMLEMQDTFREDQADEYSSLKKELEQTTKKCRILTFKLRKSERRNEQLDAEKLEMDRKLREIAGGQAGLDKAERIRQLEHELSVSNEAASRLQKELDDANSQLKEGNLQPTKKKAPLLGSIPKTPSGEKVARESLMRGGSQEDPAQLLRDLQDSLEREADLREQLRYSEEEAESLRKKASRVEEDNESLVLQLKKMATKARTRRLSPTSNRLTPEPDKDEGISDEEDPAELRIQLELNEQETGVLRRKVEELEQERDSVKRKNKELQEKLTAKLSTVAKKQALKSDSSKDIYEHKMKVMEGETSELRMKLIEKERECERLHAEISLSSRKPKLLQKSKSLDGDQQTVDLKRQLQVIESEAAILRTKIQDLETENDKLLTENKKLIMLKGTRRAGSVERSDEPKPLVLATLEKQLEEANKKIKELESLPKTEPPPPIPPPADVEKLKSQLKKSETSRKKLEESLKRIKEETPLETLSYFKQRTPRQPTEVTTKLQMKKMVDESENEISELLLSLKKYENKGDHSSVEMSQESKGLEGSLKDAKQEIVKKDKEISEIKGQISTLELEKEKLKKENENAKANWEKEKTKLEENKKEFEKNKSELDKEITSVKNELKNLKKGSDDVSSLKKKIETLTKNVEEEKKTNENLKKDLSKTKDIESDKKKLTSEIEEKKLKNHELEDKIKDLEDKLKKSEKLVNLKKEKLGKLEKEKTEKDVKLETLEKELSSAQKEKKELSNKLNESESKVKKINLELDKKKKTIEEMESKGDPKAKAVPNKVGPSEEEMKLLKEELETSKNKLDELNKKITEIENEKEEVEKLAKSKEKELKNELDHWEKKVSELENDIQAERKIMERVKAAQEMEIKAKDQEIAQLQSKNLTSGTKKLNDLKQEMQSKIERLELALESEKREYDELTSKYEQLEEEHVVIKAQLVKEKEHINSQLLVTEQELHGTEAELKALRETFNSKQDLWIKEKQKLQDRIKENEKLSEQHQLEGVRLMAVADGRQTELDQIKKDSQNLLDQNDRLRRDNEDLRKQIDDYDKVVKVQRSMTADVNALEKELKEYKTRLVMEEKTRKTELAGLKSRYDNRVTVLSNELLGAQGQVARFKKERDSYKKLLEETQRSPDGTSNRISYEGDDAKGQIAQLEQQVSCLEDELSETRVESSRLRTELLSERSAWEVKVSELNSKLNELEEERILNSGRAKITGLKTRMELAWHKERDEQQRLLQETSTLARDLRQTLFEVERERDRERLESKRRLDQVKKNSEEEQEDIKKKLHDMQCDLLELRDAHAKLRTTNEKLRRERDRWDREREAFRYTLAERKKFEQEDERKIIGVAQLVEELTHLAPDLFPSKPKSANVGPTPPMRRKSRSREASPLLERKDISRESSVGREDAKSHEVQEIMLRLSEAAQQLKKLSSDGRDKERARRALSMRSGSTDSESGLEPLPARSLQRKGSSLRKSLSLEQTAQDQNVWASDREGSVTSVTSYDTEDPYQRVYYRKDLPVDSRLSGGSTRSEVITSSEKKKKTGLFGKLKRLARAKSIESDYGSDIGSSSQFDPGSDTSLPTAEERSGRQLKDKLSGMFKRGGSSSRGNSMERNAKPPSGADSLQRPLVNAELSSSVSESSASTRVSKKPPSSAPVQRKTKK